MAGFFSDGEEPPHHLDHRRRLRTRFLAGGADALPDYELLELVLFAAIPRRDVKPLAKELVRRFGSFADAISAPPERLQEIPGVGEAVVAQFRLVEAAALRLSKTRLLNRPALSSWSALLDYCAAAMARMPHEEFRVLFLDRKNNLVADEVQKHRHSRPCARLSPRDRPPRAGAPCVRADPGAQSSQRRSDTVARRHRNDPRRLWRPRVRCALRSTTTSSSPAAAHASFKALGLM